MRGQGGASGCGCATLGGMGWKAARAWAKLVGPAYDRATGAEGERAALREIAKILGQGGLVAEDHLDEIVALMYAAYEAGRKSKT